MDPFAQAHLSELLSAARLGPPAFASDADEYKARTLMCFNATLAALKGVGAISDEEMTEWTNRMLVALGEQPLGPVPPGTARLINFGGRGEDLLRALPIRRPTPDFSAWFRYISLIGRWNTAVGSRSSGWSCTATRSPPTGGSLRYPTQKPCSPVSLLHKSPMWKVSRTISRRSFGTNSSNDFRCKDALSGEILDDVGTATG